MEAIPFVPSFKLRRRRHWKKRERKTKHLNSTTSDTNNWNCAVAKGLDSTICAQDPRKQNKNVARANGMRACVCLSVVCPKHLVNTMYTTSQHNKDNRNAKTGPRTSRNNSSITRKYWFFCCRKTHANVMTLDRKWSKKWPCGVCTRKHLTAALNCPCRKIGSVSSFDFRFWDFFRWKFHIMWFAFWTRFGYDGGIANS